MQVELLLSSFLVSLFIVMLLTPPLMRVAVKVGIVDVPDKRKVHQSAIPRIGGLAIVIGVVSSVLLWVDINQYVLSYLLGAVVILVFGLLDDGRDLNYKVKFLGQIIAVLFPVLMGGVQMTTLPFFSIEISVWLAAPLTIFLLLGVTNAINLSDGLDGLAGGSSLLALGAIALLAYLGESSGITLIALAIIGGLLGFLHYNTYPARVFMGDSGSQFLGYSAGVLVIWLTQNTNTTLSPALPLLILGLPILDTLLVMGRRTYEGRSMFSPDKNHVHHRLLAVGLKHSESVFAIYVIQSSMILSAYLARYQSDWVVLGLFMLFSLPVVGFYLASQKEGLLLARFERNSNKNKRSVQSNGHIERQPVGRAAFSMLFVFLALYIALVLLLSSQVSADISWLAIVLCALLIAVQFSKRLAAISILERICVYAAISLFVYLFESPSGGQGDIHWVLDGLIVGIAIFILLFVACAKIKKFDPTPLDYLMFFVVVVIAQTPLLQEGSYIGLMLIKMVVLFYGSELLMTHLQGRMFRFRLLFVLATAFVGLKGLLMV